MDGYVIKKGTQILNSLCLTLDNKNAFPNPNSLTPVNSDDEKAKGLAFSPFGFGVRKCPGIQVCHCGDLVAAVEVLPLQG